MPFSRRLDIFKKSFPNHHALLHNGGNIANAADDKEDNLQLLDYEEHRPEWKRAPNLFQERWNRNGKDERLGEIDFRNRIVGKGKDLLVVLVPLDYWVWVCSGDNMYEIFTGTPCLLTILNFRLTYLKTCSKDGLNVMDHLFKECAQWFIFLGRMITFACVRPPPFENQFWNGEVTPCNMRMMKFWELPACGQVVWNGWIACWCARGTGRGRRMSRWSSNSQSRHT